MRHLYLNKKNFSNSHMNKKGPNRKLMLYLDYTTNKYSTQP